MSKAPQAIRGMSDILPQQTPHWQYLEACIRDMLGSYCYDEIRMPIVEMTALFKRSIGENTDIVEKEMYTFADRNGDSLSLRPEGTASCVRAGIQHGLLHNQVRRLWYMGPMFRHERPQKGRYRQFHQLGVEAFGMAGPDIDAEQILMTARLWQTLGLDGLSLQLNSLGSTAARAAYRDILVAYFSAHADSLDEDSQRRLHGNPLRILDSKSPGMQDLIAAAPSFTEHLDAESAEHFTQLQAILDATGIDYQLNPRLVRGLDYYGKTVFEWVTDRLGAQGTVCAGGRYDGLVEHFGGRPTPAVGYAIGLERLVALLDDNASAAANAPHACLLLMGERAGIEGLALAEELRTALPGLHLLSLCGGGSFKSQFKRADKSGARLALVLGDDECARQEVTLKDLRGDAGQTTIPRQELAATLVQRLKL